MVLHGLILAVVSQSAHSVDGRRNSKESAAGEQWSRDLAALDALLALACELLTR